MASREEVAPKKTLSKADSPGLVSLLPSTGRGCGGGVGTLSQAGLLPNDAAFKGIMSMSVDYSLIKNLSARNSRAFLRLSSLGICMMK